MVSTLMLQIMTFTAVAVIVCRMQVAVTIHFLVADLNCSSYCFCVYSRQHKFGMWQNVMSWLSSSALCSTASAAAQQKMSKQFNNEFNFNPTDT